MGLLQGLLLAGQLGGQTLPGLQAGFKQVVEDFLAQGFAPRIQGGPKLEQELPQIAQNWQ